MDRWREPQSRPLWQRLAWLIAIWMASVAALGLFAELLHAWIG